MWYVVQPLVGWVIGALVYLVIGGLLPTSDSASSGAQVALSLLPSVLACLIGFFQQMILAGSIGSPKGFAEQRNAARPKGLTPLTRSVG